MGVVQRQTIKNNLISYLGVGIGVISMLYVYPKDLELKGFAEGLLKFAALLVPVFNLGMTSVIVRYGAYLKGGPQRATAQLLSRSLVAITAALILLSLANWLFGEAIAQLLLDSGRRIGLLSTHRWEIISLLALMSYSGVITAALINYHRIAIPVVFNNLMVKLGLPALILAVYYNLLSSEYFVPLLILLHVLILVCLFAYYFRMSKPRLNWGKLTFQDSNFKDMVSLAAFAMIGSVGSVLATQIDIISVNTFLGNIDTGVYSFAVFTVAVMAISYRAVSSITGPIISKAWKEHDMVKIEETYRDAAQVLFAMGGLIYVGAVTCLPIVYQITEDTGQYAPGYLAAILLGGGQLVEQMTSINNTLIGYSDFFRWNVLFVVLLGLFNIVLNYFFIVTLDYGITGAALSTMLSLSAFNLVKVLFIYWKMDIHPFSISLLYSGLALAGIAALVFALPNTGYPYLDLMLHGLLVVVLFYGYLRFTKGAPLLSKALNGGLKNIW